MSFRLKLLVYIFCFWGLKFSSFAVVALSLMMSSSDIYWIESIEYSGAAVR